MSTINEIGHYLGKDQESEVFITSTHKEKGEVLEQYLSEICELAEEIDILTGGVNVDIDYLLGIQGSYIIGIREGEFTEGETKPPSLLYAESLFPSLEEAKGIEVQTLEEEEELEYNTEDDGGDAA